MDTSYGKPGDNLFDDLVTVVADLEKVAPDLRNEFGYNKLLLLADRYRPRSAEWSHADLYEKTRTMSRWDATKTLRALLGLGLRESVELLDAVYRQHGHQD